MKMKNFDFDTESTPLLPREQTNQTSELSWTESWRNLKTWHKAWTSLRYFILKPSKI